MIGSKYSPDNYMSLKISIGSLIKIPEMLRFVPDQLKTKKMCKNAAKTLPCLMRYVPDQCKTKQMCNKVILEHGGTLMLVSDC